MTTKPQIVREFEELTGLDKDETADLKDFALQNQRDAQGKFRPVLEWRNGKLKAQNYVGIIQTRKGTVLEILPKVDFGHGSDDDVEKTKQVFVQMLSTWRGVNHAQFNASGIQAMQRFNMLEIFVRLFLTNLVRLTQRGLAKHYQSVEENLPCLKGRILFPQHIRANVANRARFYVQYDDFNANRPANRLIHSTIDKLQPMIRQPGNQQLLHQMKIYFNDIPISHNHDDDWRKQKIDRAMQHYQATMQWIGLFLFGQGLTTFSGRHINHCLLFPMEQIFEDFVAHHFRRYEHGFNVRTQAPQKILAQPIHGEGRNYTMQPDITLCVETNPKFILDTKWKSFDKNDIKHSDMYQLFAYGKQYGCKKVVLIYPSNANFKKEEYVEYRFDDDVNLFCLPFDVTEPNNSVKEIIEQLPC
ncbi:McrC family protein [Candidatus Spongiihabitans sp.]|uniref:McrC family protein n=1 Tax=Candidatus Spongiihabitans sp. TaxID=3101308 RepID=UPI003C7CD5EE